MKLGTCLPTDESARVNGQFSLEKAAEALATAGIRGCLTNFPTEESQWKAYSVQLKNALRHTGVELLEYNMPLFLSSASGENRESEAERTVRLLELAEETGCLNVGTCIVNNNGLGPDLKSRSREYYDNTKATCELIGRKAEKRGLKARLLPEMVYTTVTWSPTELVRLLDDVGSPNVRGHMDIANCLTFDRIFIDHSEFIRESFHILGNRICSAHLKDIRPAESYFPGLVEVLVGDGVMDIRSYLQCLDKMPAAFPIVIEHMNRMEDIKRSYDRTCQMAQEIGVEVWR